MTLNFLTERLWALLRWFAPLPICCLVGILIGCGSASNPVTQAPTTPVNPTPTVKAKFVYTGNQGASISGYSVDASTGSLSPLQGFPLAVGISPESITHDPQNRFLIASDISAALLHVYSIDANSGALTEVSPSPYNTMIESETVVVDPSGTHVYLYRTGSRVSYPGVSGNQIVAFNLSSTGVLSAVKDSPFAIATPGDSACGMLIDTAGKVLYLKDSSHLYAFGIDAATGSLNLLQTLPAQLFGGIALAPAGNYLYVAGSTSLQSYVIDAASGLLRLAKSTPMATQSSAYTISLSPDGTFAYTIENNNDLVAYTVNDGEFLPVGTIFSGVYGQQIAIDPSGHFVYVPQTCSYCASGTYNVIHQFSIANTGALSQLGRPTVPSGVTPFGITITSQ